MPKGLDSSIQGLPISLGYHAKQRSASCEQVGHGVTQPSLSRDVLLLSLPPPFFLQRGGSSSHELPLGEGGKQEEAIGARAYARVGNSPVEHVHCTADERYGRGPPGTPGRRAPSQVAARQGIQGESARRRRCGVRGEVVSADWLTFSCATRHRNIRSRPHPRMADFAMEHEQSTTASSPGELRDAKA